MFETKVVEKIKTHILRSIPFPKFVQFMRQCGKILYSRTGQSWQYNTAHALCVLAK